MPPCLLTQEIPEPNANKGQYSLNINMKLVHRGILKRLKEFEFISFRYIVFRATISIKITKNNAGMCQDVFFQVSRYNFPYKSQVRTSQILNRMRCFYIER